MHSCIKSKFSLFSKNSENSNIILPKDQWDDIQSCFVYDKINKYVFFDNKKYLENKSEYISIQTYSPEDNLQYANIIIDPLLAKFMLINIFGESDDHNIKGGTSICCLIHNETNTCFDLYKVHNVFKPLNPLFTIRTPYNNIETTPKIFIDDFIFLLNFLCNHQQEYKTQYQNYWKEKSKLFSWIC
jgi:hypothetical protein